MNVKKPLSILLVILMISMMLTSFPFTANAVDIDSAAIGDGTVIDVSTAAKLEAACAEINTNGGEYTINLQANITNGIIDIHHSSAVVTVIGNGYTITQPTSAVHVSNGAELTLGDEQSTLIIRGTDEPHTTPEDHDDPGCIYVLPGSVCNMKSGVTIIDHRRNNYLGGGVSVQGGTFHMFGGTIDHCGVDGGSVCYGGGVAVYAGGTFIMDGGTISNCYATTNYIEENELYRNCYAGMGGGVFVSEGSVFTMNGGTITDNTATNFGGGVAMTLSDVETQIDPETGEEIIDPDTNKGKIDKGNPRSKAAIYGGTISNNTANSGAGVFASGLIYSFAHTLAAGILDTGDPFEPGLFIDGGVNKAVEISSNKATDMGGGVLVNGLKDTRKAQIYNAEIINNTAAKGAGVMNYSYWTQMDIDGCTISDNASTSNGGGVMATGDSDGGYTAIKDTEITDNTSGARGAGVYYDVESEIRISGADVIQNNKLNGKLNNLNIFSLKKPVKVVGGLTGSQIGLSDPTLWDDGKEDYDAEAVSTLRLTDGYKANNASLNPKDVFTSDHESWIVDFGDEYESPKTTYRYTAKKYDNTLGLPEGYDVNTRDNGEIFIKVPATKFTGYTENVGYLYDELCYLYGNANRNTFVRDYELYGYLSTYPGKIYYDSIMKTYVAVFRMADSSIYVLTSSDSNSFENFEYENALSMASGGVQRFLNSEENILCLKIYYYYDENDIPGLFNDYTEVELEYDEPLDFKGAETKTIYKIDAYGYATTKYVIDSNSKEEVGSYDYTNEVRLVRADINYHINNDVIDDNYNNNDIFTSYVETAIGKEVTVGDTISSFYAIPEVTPTAQNSCPYIFKGWYYDPDNDDDDSPVHFGTDKYAAGKDIYAHWIKVESVEKDAEDPYSFQTGGNTYGGFDLAGAQISERIIDTNFDYEHKPGGMRFITSLSMDVVDEINSIKPDNIEYGYVAATNDDWIEYHRGYEKLQYVSKRANGINTLDPVDDKDYFGFAKNVNCTSKIANSENGVVKEDHRNYSDYLLYTLVITYEDGQGYDKNVLARPYIRYTDANGLERVAYSEYLGTNVLGGCYTNYNYVISMVSSGN